MAIIIKSITFKKSNNNKLLPNNSFLMKQPIINDKLLKVIVEVNKKLLNPSPLNEKDEDEKVSIIENHLKLSKDNLNNIKKEIIPKKQENLKLVLIVEDNKLNQNVAKKMLEKLGYQSEISENGKLAYKSFTEKPKGYYKFILMDCQMPGNSIYFIIF